MKISVFWFRRDLRLEDNTALNMALNSDYNVLPIFIFDKNILNDLPIDDPRVTFIYELVSNINEQLKKVGSSLKIYHGDVLDCWKNIVSEFEIDTVYINKDYEPYAIARDTKVYKYLKSQNIELKGFKDQVIFEKNEVVKKDNTPYTIFTPYKRLWLAHFASVKFEFEPTKFENFYAFSFVFPNLSDLGFVVSKIKVLPYDLTKTRNYGEKRDFPSQGATSRLGPHLRFGSVSIRKIISQLDDKEEVFLSELIWREFFMQILFHFPKVVNQNFKAKYNGILWRNDEEDFKKWCEGKTGYPLVDAGMRELNKTGYMHNRVRMVCASFLCKHLLIDWTWGEAYFAEKLLDYELSSNNGNWQWAASTGCDSVPYFRIFNPTEQVKRFDKSLDYIKKWVSDFNTMEYPMPMVEHSFARKRALEVYKEGISRDS